MDKSERANEILDALRSGVGIDVDTTVWVSVASLAKLLADNEHLKRQVNDLHRANSVLHAKAEAARASEASMRDVVKANGAEEMERVTKELVTMTEYRDTSHANWVSTQGALWIAIKERDEARAELASVNASRDEVASACAVPVELARLYKAAQGARAKWGGGQFIKLAEECAEYIVEIARPEDRQCDMKTCVEAHDVLTVALSLCEPALMAKAAERLEGRLK